MSEHNGPENNNAGGGSTEAKLDSLVRHMEVMQAQLTTLMADAASRQQAGANSSDPLLGGTGLLGRRLGAVGSASRSRLETISDLSQLPIDTEHAFQRQAGFAKPALAPGQEFLPLLPCSGDPIYQALVGDRKAADASPTALMLEYRFAYSILSYLCDGIHSLRQIAADYEAAGQPTAWLSCTTDLLQGVARLGCKRMTQLQTIATYDASAARLLHLSSFGPGGFSSAADATDREQLNELARLQAKELRKQAAEPKKDKTPGKSGKKGQGQWKSQGGQQRGGKSQGQQGAGPAQS